MLSRLRSVAESGAWSTPAMLCIVLAAGLTHQGQLHVLHFRYSDKSMPCKLPDKYHCIYTNLYSSRLQGVLHNALQVLWREHAFSAARQFSKPQ
jgi:hypothetical protein